MRKTFTSLKASPVEARSEFLRRASFRLRLASQAKQYPMCQYISSLPIKYCSQVSINFLPVTYCLLCPSPFLIAKLDIIAQRAQGPSPKLFSLCANKLPGLFGRIHYKLSFIFCEITFFGQWTSNS